MFAHKKAMQFAWLFYTHTIFAIHDCKQCVTTQRQWLFY